MTLKKIVMIAALCAAMAAAPASAQSLLQQFHNLKGSMNTLTGHKPQPTASDPAAATNTPAAIGARAEVLRNEDLVDDTSQTTLSSVAAHKGVVSTYDIRGFKLGMSPSEVQTIARQLRIRAKYPNVANPYTGTFELEATRLANRQLSSARFAKSKRMLSEAYGVFPDGSGIHFAFTLMPAGPELSNIEYETKQNGQTDQELRQAMQTRYGKPDKDMAFQEFWCGGDQTCGISGNSASLSEYHSNGQLRMELYQSEQYKKRAQAALNARVAQIAASTGSKANF